MEADESSKSGQRNSLSSPKSANAGSSGNTSVQTEGSATGSHCSPTTDITSGTVEQPQQQDSKEEPSSKHKKKKKKKKKSSDGSTTNIPSAPSTTTSGTPGSVRQSGDGVPQSNLQQELEWCIAQLELGLLRENATKQQKQENEKYVRSLRSEKTPLPRKRQLMKNLFGDYRSRMVREPIPRYSHSQDPVPSISCVNRSVESGGKFFRRSVQKVSGEERVNGECPGEVGVNVETAESGNTFCFDFDVEPH